MRFGFLGFLVFLVSGQLHAQGGANQDHLNCTSNLSAVYAEPASERRLIGARFLDENLALETITACEAQALASDEAAADLWLAYAYLASDRSDEALAALAKISFPPTGVYGQADPRVRAALLRGHIFEASLPTPGEGHSSPVFGLFADQALDPNRLAALGQAGLIGPDQIIAVLEGQGDFSSLIEIYTGTLVLDPAGTRLGPDLSQLRSTADAAAAHEDPLISLMAQKQAAVYYDRGFDRQGLVADPGAAQDRLDQGMLTGLATWFDITQPEEYRDAIATQALPLVGQVLEQSQSQEAIEAAGEAVALDWAGLQSVQGLNPLAAEAIALEIASPLARARALIGETRAGQLDGDVARVALSELAALEPCVFDLWAQHTYLGDVPTAGSGSLIDEVLALYAQGQDGGKAGAFVGAGELYRWGQVGGAYDFSRAHDLFSQALEQGADGDCGRGDRAAAHFNLGWLAFNGQGTEQNLSAAREHFLAAAQLGNFAAAEALAEIYAFGLSVPQDPVLAHEFATKAFLWNNLENQTFLALTLFQDQGLALPGLSADGPQDLRLAPRADALRFMGDAARDERFQGTLYLALAALDDPAVLPQNGVAGAPEDLLATLGGAMGDFERGYAASGASRTSHFDRMRAELADIDNLAFTPARYDAAGGWPHDPKRALAFYQAMARTNPAAERLLALDRAPYLTANGEVLMGPGPHTLADIVALDLGDEMNPLPFHLLLSP